MVKDGGRIGVGEEGKEERGRDKKNMKNRRTKEVSNSVGVLWKDGFCLYSDFRRGPHP